MRGEVGALLNNVALHYDYEGRVWCPIVGESGTDPRTGLKGKRLLGSDSIVLQACVLGLPCKDGNSVQTVPLLTDIETA